MTTTAKQVECYRCSGTGYYQWMTYSGHLDGGTCFRCKGTGIDPNPVKAGQHAEQVAAGHAQVERARANKEEERARREYETEIDHTKSRIAKCKETLAGFEKDGNEPMAEIMRDALAQNEAQLAALTKRS